MKSRELTVALTALLVLVCLCYLHGQYQEYVFDDAYLIRSNENLRAGEYLPGIFGLGKGVPTHRMVRNLSYAMDFAVWGNDLRGFHITNIFIHLLNTILVFWMGRRVFGAGPWAFFVALLWGVHPVQTDSVTYLSGRRDVLAGLFYFWAMDQYLSWRVDGASRWALARCLALYVTGCFAKEVAVTLPAVIVLFEVVRARRHVKDGLAALWGQAKAQFMVAPVFYTGLALFPVCFTYYVLRWHPYNIGSHYITPRLPLDFLSVATYGLHYLKLMVFPLHLSLDYFPQSLPGSRGIGDPTTLLALGVHASLAAITVYAIARGSHAGFGAGWFVITFLPMSNLLIRSNEPVAEHYLYLPSFGFVVALVAGARALAGRRPGLKIPVLVALGALSLALGIRTDLRNRAWEDPENVYVESLGVFPRSSRIWNNRACLWMDRQDMEKALGLIDRAIEISPKEALYHYNRGFALRKLGRLEEALVSYDASVKASETYLDAHIGRAFCLILAKKFDLAIKAYDHLIKWQGESDRGWYYHHWRGVACREKGDYAGSRASFAVALAKGKRHPESLWQLAMTAAAEKKWAEAESLLQEAIKEAPESAVLRGVLGDMYRDQGKAKEAIDAYTEMAKANEDYTADAAVKRAKLYLQLGRIEEARAAYQVARSYEFKDPELEARFPAPGK